MIVLVYFYRNLPKKLPRVPTTLTPAGPSPGYGTPLQEVPAPSVLPLYKHTEPYVAHHPTPAIPQPTIPTYHSQV